MKSVATLKPGYFDAPHSDHYSHRRVIRVSAMTEDGSSIEMMLGDASHRLSARQADTLAQGLLMALLRAGLGVGRMPWIGGLLKVTPYDGKKQPLRFSDDTWYDVNPTFRFMGVGWLYESTGADPEYPANAVCIQTLHDGGILFSKGNDEHLLETDQAYQLCISLSDCAYSLGTRTWRIWDRIIEWRKQAETSTMEPSADEQALFDLLNSYPSRFKPSLR